MSEPDKRLRYAQLRQFRPRSLVASVEDTRFFVGAFVSIVVVYSIKFKNCAFRLVQEQKIKSDPETNESRYIDSRRRSCFKACFRCQRTAMEVKEQHASSSLRTEAKRDL